MQAKDARSSGDLSDEAEREGGSRGGGPVPSECASDGEPTVSQRMQVIARTSRVAAHNAGRSPHTASGRPWRVDVMVEFADERRAAAFERYLKLVDYFDRTCALCGFTQIARVDEDVRVDDRTRHRYRARS